MKKLIVFALVLAMALAVPTAVLADTFVSSPSNQAAPKLDDVKAPEGWDGEIIITPFADRDKLAEAESEKLEAAYDSIKAAKTVTELNSGLKDVAAAVNVSADALAVSNLFDITSTKEGTVTIALSVADAKNFVALLHYNGKAWEVVNTKVEGGKITFTASDFSPYAIVVSTDKTPDSPTTGEALPMGIIALAVLFGAASVCFFVKSKANA